MHWSWSSLATHARTANKKRNLFGKLLAQVLSILFHSLLSCPPSLSSFLPSLSSPRPPLSHSLPTHLPVWSLQKESDFSLCIKPTQKTRYIRRRKGKQNVGIKHTSAMARLGTGSPSFTTNRGASHRRAPSGTSILPRRSSKLSPEINETAASQKKGEENEARSRSARKSKRSEERR